MEVVHVAPEFAPLVKAGGLADVVYSLSRELTIANHACTIILPFYDLLDSKKIEGFSKTAHIVTTREGNRLIPWEVFSGEYEGISLLFLAPSNNYFSRGTIYGEKDDNDRFILFCCAAREVITTFFENAVIHLHDWQTALLAPLLHESHHIVYTIHNLAYQGVCNEINLKRAYLEHLISSLRHPKSALPTLALGGIEFAYAITTVSKTYAEEIQTEAFGCGLEDIISHHAPKLIGIQNGLNTSYWNPSTDKTLPAKYTLHDPDLFTKKQENKKALFHSFSKPYVDAPLVCSITRLVPQKNPGLIDHGLRFSLQSGASIALSGTPCDITQALADKLQDDLGTHERTMLHFGFDEHLAHLIYAAADFILIPSAFEPCGLTQMIALLYGAIPIVTPVGGLKDTIIDFSSSNGNGIILTEHTNEAIEHGIKRALSLSEQEKRTLLQNIDPTLFSWKSSLTQYVELYESLVSGEPL